MERCCVMRVPPSCASFERSRRGRINSRTSFYLRTLFAELWYCYVGIACNTLSGRFCATSSFHLLNNNIVGHVVIAIRFTKVEEACVEEISISLDLLALVLGGFQGYSCTF